MRHHFWLAGLLAVSLLGGTGAKAGLIGDTIHGGYELSNGGANFQIIDYGNAVVGAGLEFPSISGGALSANFSDTQLVISVLQNDPFNPAFPFNGSAFQDLTNAFITASLDAATTQSGFTSANLNVLNGDLQLNFSGLTLNAGSKIVVDFAGGATVPEPTSLSLLIAGIAGVSVLRRRGKLTAL